MTPDPPVMEITLARTSFARRPLATRLSPVVSVEPMLAAPVGTAYGEDNLQWRAVCRSKYASKA